MPAPPIPLAERFWAKVDRRGPDECWPWTGGTNNHGHGYFDLGSRKEPLRTTAHRVAYQLTYGPIPAGRGNIVARTCGNQACMNPAHLRVATKAGLELVPFGERFWSKVSKRGPGECWPWLSAMNVHGYGAFGTAGRMKGAHRIAYALTHGPIPRGLYVCHRCDNRSCTNPAHLFLGTHRDNMDDMVAKGRSPGTSLPGEMNGRAKLTTDDVLEIRAAFKTGSDMDQLAIRFGVTRANVRRIVANETWLCAF